MPVDSLKRLWPFFVSPKVRDWFNEHLTGGTLERIVIAVNAPLESLKTSGSPVPDDGLSLEAVATGCLIRPLDGLPALRDADLNVHIVGRDATVTLGKATADLSSARKLTMSSGSFEVPDTAAQLPTARIRFKLEGPVPAAAELLRMDRLRDVSDLPFDPSAVRGTMSAQVSLGNAGQGRSTTGLDQLRDHRRRYEFLRRPHDHGPESRGGGVAGDRHPAGLPA